MTNADKNKLNELFSQIGESVSLLQKKQFERYFDLLQLWNQRTNLISRSDVGFIVERHFAESLAVFSSFSVPEKGRILDVGSGGGFPGVPMAILRPDVEIFLNESKRMKALFLREVAEELDLRNVQVLMDRCENLKSEERFVASFDIVVSRAVGKLSHVFSWIKPLLRKEGIFIAWKGGNVQQEVDELQQKEVSQTVKIIEMDRKLVDPERKRCFVVVGG